MRLAATIRPSTTVSSPSRGLPSTAGLTWKRSTSPVACASIIRCSICCEAMRTRPRVWPSMRMASPEMSSTPAISPRPPKIGAAAQPRAPWPARKCSPPRMASGRRSTSTVPMALVPHRRSDHSTPGSSAARSALGRKSGLPTSSRMTPAASVTMTTQPWPMACSASASSSGWALASSRREASRRSRRPAASSGVAAIASTPAPRDRAQDRAMCEAMSSSGTRPWLKNTSRARSVRRTMPVASVIGRLLACRCRCRSSAVACRRMARRLSRTVSQFATRGNAGCSRFRTRRTAFGPRAAPPPKRPRAAQG